MNGLKWKLGLRYKFILKQTRKNFGLVNGVALFRIKSKVEKGKKMFRAKVCHMISVKGSGGSQDKK